MKFIWPESARAELRAVDRDAAGRILRALTQYGESGAGDVKALTGQWQSYYRLRVADYRIIFAISPDEITVVRVRHRSEIYR
jgi:mRNA-degrading endonuclease RelE of RelBE toxin-antitoxin system